MKTAKNPFVILWLTLSVAASWVGNQAQAVEYKGVGGVYRPGTLIDLNHHVEAKVQHTALMRIASAEESKTTLPRADIEADFLYSRPGKNGRQFALENGSRLHQDDEFTIVLHAHLPRYVYLFHFDGHGQLHELVTASGYGDNYMKGGEERELPARDSLGNSRHFVMDERPGVETMHLIVASEPQFHLMQKYKVGLLRSETLQSPETKGIYIALDGTPQRSSQAAGPRRLVCNAMSEYCRETFIIHHEPGRQPPQLRM